jgi:hypothetical protein
MCPVNNAGIYADIPRYVDCTVYRPIDQVLENDWAWDFSTGSHSNTEQVYYDSSYSLKCSHTGGVLIGTWASPVYDLGSIKEACIEGNFADVAVEGSKTWDTVVGVRTWDAWAGVMNWANAIRIDWSDVLKAVLYYGLTDPPTSQVEISAVVSPQVEARYVRVAVTIADPSLDSNMYLKTLEMEAWVI